MLTLDSVRTRWSGLVGPFVALALGVALVAATGLVLWGTIGAPDRAPQRYSRAAAVVVPVEELSVQTRHGVRSRPLAVRHGLTPTDLASLGPGVVDRWAYARLVTGRPSSGRVGRYLPAEVGRPWPVVGFSSHRLASGRGPVADDEVAVWAGGAAQGERVTVLTVDGPRPYTVVGVLAPARFERALFFTDAEAARISPRVDALIVPAAGLDTVPPSADLRTGQQLRALDPDAAGDSETLVALNAFVGTAGGIAVFASGFVVSSGFAYAVARRRRELALLRTVGATAGQVRRMVLAEGMIVGLLAVAAGGALSRPAALHLAAALTERGFAPDWFTVPHTLLPLVLAACLGLVAAMAGAAPAAWRAGRVSPIAALRESVVEDRPMTPPRWLFGLAALAGALYVLGGPVLTAPAAALKRKDYVPGVMLLIIALAVLAPVLVPPAARLLGWPLSRLRGATGLLIGQTARAAARRTAATAAPVLLTVGLATCLLGIASTVDHAKAIEALPRDGFLVVPAGTPGLDRALVDRLRAIPGVDVSVSYPTALYELEDGVALLEHPAQAVDPGGLAGLPVLSGSLDDLRDDTVVVDTDWNRRVGETVRVWHGDGTPVTLRVAAVVREGVSGNGAFVTRAHVSAELASRAFARPRAGVAPGAAADALRAAVAGHEARLLSPRPASGRGVTLAGMWVVIGVTVLYAGVSIVGTVLMAGPERRRDLALLRLVGATTGQRVRFVAAEAVFVTGLGVALAMVAAGVTLGGVSVALLRLTGMPIVPVVPWGGVGAVVAVAAGLTLGTSILSVVPVRRAAEARRSRLGERVPYSRGNQDVPHADDSWRGVDRGAERGLHADDVPGHQ